ncbi:MAG: glycine zipper 2TM domain-containing protein [Pseudomonadota bacterium]
MNRCIPFAASLVSAVFFSTAATAGSQGRDRYKDRYQGDTDYAQVLSARPVYSEVRVGSPREECWQERVVYRDELRSDYRDDYRSNAADRTIGTVIGGVIGGAIGHQFSQGSGKQIATAIGAVVGADVGRNAVNNNRYNDRGSRYETRERVAYEPRCRTVEEARYESRIEGYDVTYRYNGQVYQTRMPYDPGARLAVNVQVSPVRY